MDEGQTPVYTFHQIYEVLRMNNVFVYLVLLAQLCDVAVA